MGLCNTKPLNKPVHITKTKYYENGDVKSVTFYSNKKIHREQESKVLMNGNEPNSNEPNSNSSSEPNGSEPAFISYFPGNRLQTQQWFKNGILHRDGDNPALISVYRFAGMNQHQIDLEYVRDNIWKYVQYSYIDRIELYYVNGKLHNKNGPAYIQYQNGAKQKEIWMQKGQRYRQNGLPTTVDYFSNGQIQEEVNIVE